MPFGWGFTWPWSTSGLSTTSPAIPQPQSTHQTGLPSENLSGLQSRSLRPATPQAVSNPPTNSNTSAVSPAVTTTRDAARQRPRYHTHNGNLTLGSSNPDLEPRTQVHEDSQMSRDIQTTQPAQSTPSQLSHRSAPLPTKEISPEGLDAAMVQWPPAVEGAVFCRTRRNGDVPGTMRTVILATRTGRKPGRKRDRHEATIVLREYGKRFVFWTLDVKGKRSIVHLGNSRAKDGPYWRRWEGGSHDIIPSTRPTEVTRPVTDSSVSSEISDLSSTSSETSEIQRPSKRARTANTTIHEGFQSEIGNERTRAVHGSAIQASSPIQEPRNVGHQGPHENATSRHRSSSSPEVSLMAQHQERTNDPTHGSAQQTQASQTTNSGTNHSVDLTRDRYDVGGAAEIKVFVDVSQRRLENAKVKKEFHRNRRQELEAE
ncbi:MAG: hypothetical protein Q9224_006016, partial [Gallowayella concinna]